MKKRRLRKWVKVVLSIILLVVGVLVYKHAVHIGGVVKASDFNATVCILDWFYLLVIQFLFLNAIWEN